jgi:hypothetical protein
MAFLVVAGAQEQKVVTPESETKVVEPAPKPVTHLKVILLDGINNKMFELSNCIVQVIGELHVCDDSFNYSNTFTDGANYEITISIETKD